jgi:hypothetical protein
MEASQEVLVDLFGRIENFFRRLESYTEVWPTSAMMNVIVNIMIEVLSILAIATKDIKKSRASELIAANWSGLTYRYAEKYIKNLIGKNDIESALKRLDTLTEEEARMATVEALKITRGIDDRVNVVLDGAQWIVIKLCSLCQRFVILDGRETKHYVDEAKRSSPHFVCELPRLIHHHRGTVTTRDQKMALSTRSFHKSQHSLQCPTSGDSHLVLWQWYLPGVEIDPITLVGERKTYVHLNFRGFIFISCVCSGIWQEYSLVCDSSVFFSGMNRNIVE